MSAARSWQSRGCASMPPRRGSARRRQLGLQSQASKDVSCVILLGAKELNHREHSLHRPLILLSAVGTRLDTSDATRVARCARQSAERASAAVSTMYAMDKDGPIDVASRQNDACLLKRFRINWVWTLVLAIGNYIRGKCFQI